MIGFLFLTYDNVFNERIWIEYFRNVDPKKFRIFVHPKNISLIKKQRLFKNFILPKICKTSWGDFSLIKAQNLLMKTALKTSQITHVILENCITFFFVAIIEIIFFTNIASKFIPALPSTIFTSLLSSLKDNYK
jgi:hypothetical protein